MLNKCCLQEGQELRPLKRLLFIISQILMWENTNFYNSDQTQIFLCFDFICKSNKSSEQQMERIPVLLVNVYVSALIIVHPVGDWHAWNTFAHFLWWSVWLQMKIETKIFCVTWYHEADLLAVAVCRRAGGVAQNGDSGHFHLQNTRNPFAEVVSVQNHKMCFNKRSSQVFVNECWWSCVWERNCSRNLGNFTRVLSHKSHLLWIMRLFYFSIARSRLEKRLLFLLVRSKTCARYFHFILASLSVSRTIFFILHSFAHFITEFIYYTIFYSTILLCSVVAAFLLLLCHEYELLTLCLSMITPHFSIFDHF